MGKVNEPPLRNNLQATECYINVAVGIYSVVRIVKRGSNHDIAPFLSLYLSPDSLIESAQMQSTFSIGINYRIVITTTLQGYLLLGQGVIEKLCKSHTSETETRSKDKEIMAMK